jgi:PAS domain S-box-containing protein
VADHLVNAVVVVDDVGRIAYANPAAGRLLGWDVTTLFGVDFAELVPERDRSTVRARLTRLVADHPAPVSEPPGRMTMLRTDGAEVPVDAGLLVVDPDLGRLFTIVALWDVRDRVDIAGYQRVSDDLVGLLSTASGAVPDVIRRLLATLGRALGFQIATAWRWNDDEELLRCEQVWQERSGPHAEPFAVAEVSLGMTVRPGEGLPGFVVDSGEPYWTSDLTATPNLLRHDALVADRLISAFLFPIRAGSRLVGVIELFSTVPRTLDGPLLEAVGTVGARLGDSSSGSSSRASGPRCSRTWSVPGVSRNSSCAPTGPSPPPTGSATRCAGWPR